MIGAILLESATVTSIRRLRVSMRS
jgi:hypothetical protein